jgi:hypothetical protein
MTPRRHVVSRQALTRLGAAGALCSALVAPLLFGAAIARVGALYPQSPLAWLLPATGAVLALAPLVVVGRELRRRPVR